MNSLTIRDEILTITGHKRVRSRKLPCPLSQTLSWADLAERKLISPIRAFVGGRLSGMPQGLLLQVSESESSKRPLIFALSSKEFGSPAARYSFPEQQFLIHGPGDICQHERPDHPLSSCIFKGLGLYASVQFADEENRQITQRLL
jgi:hypothetical protein